MAALHKPDSSFLERRRQVEQAKNSGGGLRSFLHRRNNSDGIVPPSSFNPTPALAQLPLQQASRSSNHHNNNQSGPMTTPRNSINHDGPESPGPPPKGNLANLPTRFTKEKGPADAASPEKPRSTTTNLVALLSRPKSSRNLRLNVDQPGKNKENRKPSGPGATDSAAAPPVCAHFCRVAFGQAASVLNSPYEMSHDPFTDTSLLNLNNFLPSQVPSRIPGQKQRPKSFQSQHGPEQNWAHLEEEDRVSIRGRLNMEHVDGRRSRSSTCAKGRSKSRNRVLSALPNRNSQNSKSESPTPSAREANGPDLDPDDVDKHLETMLDRRNIPENQRHKMRTLTDTIKMEFIRQDWAENEAKRLARPPTTNDSDDSTVDTVDTVNAPNRDNEKKHLRGRSFTFTRNSWRIGASPTKSKKKNKDAYTKGHARIKSADSNGNERPLSAGSHSSSGIIAKITGQHPCDYVNYLRRVSKPDVVEVGKLHKLRILLRNERVAWTEEFVKMGGMKETVGLLHRIMDVEWREEHEDALLHENLLCLKALCTTALAMQYLHSIQDTLFPALINMIFDPDRKGPSEFTTRNIITSVLFTYIQSGSAQERVERASSVLCYLRDREPTEDERPVDFVLGMRRERPYRVWNKEALGVTKEVFWIFLHQLNVVAMPASHKSSEDMRCTASNPESLSRSNCLRSTTNAAAAADDDPFAYMRRHFPQERPPVPAAPYVGGVEWDATNYLASHLDIMNAIVACTPTMAERNSLRYQFRVSGWERCLGGSLRLCKEKFYPAVHDALRTWVAAAADDGWDVRDVRFGPPVEPRSSSPKKAGAGAGADAGGAGAAAAAKQKKNKKKKSMDEAPPRLEVAELDFILDGPLSPVS